MDHDLLETLRLAQRFGFFGDRPIDEAAEHSRDFSRAIDDIGPGARVIDLGSGGGLPGLVIAGDRTDLSFVLLDRRQKRTDFLERAVARLGWGHVGVRCADVVDVLDEVNTGTLEPFDVVTARGFGPPEFTLRSAVGLLAGNGRIVISEPPTGDRWSTDLLSELGLSSERRGAVRVFQPI